MASQPIPVHDSQHRRLRKKAPAIPSNSSVNSTTNSPTLRRAPSAPIHQRYSTSSNHSPSHIRTSTLPSPGTSSNTSIDSTLAANPSTAPSHSQRQQHSYANDRSHYYHPRLSVTEKTSADLLGSRFDSAAVLNSINQTGPYSVEPQKLDNPEPTQAPSPRPPQPQHSYSIDSRPAGTPQLRQSASFHPAGGRQMDTVTPPRGDLGTRSPRQRYSDEANQSKANKKKSGFSSFMSNLGVSSPRRPQISAPENPVHVTHVGYDQETGEFTVSRIILVPQAAPLDFERLRQGCAVPSLSRDRN